MGLLCFLFGWGGPSSVVVEKDRPRRKDIPQIVGTGLAPPRLQPHTLPPKVISAKKPAQPAGPLPRPDPSAQQNVTLHYCRYAKREERAERAQIVYRHACTPGPTILKGKCYVIDGDTISINSVPIRLAGIDAPELDHPYGNSAKWAMVAITKGQIITARIARSLSAAFQTVVTLPPHWSSKVSRLTGRCSRRVSTKSTSPKAFAENSGDNQTSTAASEALSGLYPCQKRLRRCLLGRAL